MKTVLYDAPAVLYLLISIGGSLLSGRLDGMFWLSLPALGALIAAALLLSRGKWWGALFGMACGAGMLLFDLVRPENVFRQWPLGAVLLLYFCICAWVCRQNRTGKKDLDEPSTEA